jgi:uncharacterized secreted protein with C-terminal beta-propeller domain
MTSRQRVVLVLAFVLLAAFAAGTVQASTGGKSGRLVAFRSCADMLGYAKSHASGFVGPYGFGAQVKIAVTAKGAATAAAPPAAAEAARDNATPQEGVDYSGTNVQEAGVDEPDSIKTNGKTLFAIVNGAVNAVDVTGAAPRLLDSLELDNGWSNELLLHGDRLLVLSRGGYWATPLPAMARAIMPINRSESVLTEIDVSNPRTLKVVRTLTLDGSYIDARLVGSAVRIVSSSQMPVELPFATPTSATSTAIADAKTRNYAVLNSSRVAAWLPYYKIGKRAEHAAVQCRDVRRPTTFSGLGLLTVLTFDLDKGLDPVDSVAIMTDARIVYASQGSLYVTTESWADRPAPSTPTVAPNTVRTTIHRFDISNPTKTVYRGSGSVEGYLLNQWSLSEFQGVLRVVSTDSPAWWGPSAPVAQSYLTTLRQADGGLVQAGRVGGLGQGERVYAVRFAGNAGYVVTFKQVDPLYTMDLSDPEHPAVLGELTIPGYSAYLHPINESLLLGVGQDVDDQGHRLGTQISLFDVSDLKHPTRLHTTTLGQGWSEAESSHHAFLYWPATGLVVVPFGQQAVGMRVSRAGGISELGRIVHTAANSSSLPEIHRSLVVGGGLLTVSDAGVAAHGLSSFASLGWAAFPAPAPAPSPVPVPGGVVEGDVGGGPR